MPKLKNPKHELLAKNILKKKFNLTKAYQETYNSSYDNANKHVVDVVKRGGILNRVEEIAIEKGLTLETFLDDLNSCRRATKPIVIDGKVLDYADFAVRHEVTKTGLKLHGALGSDNQINNIDARTANISLDTKDIERLGEVVKAMQALRQSKT